MKHLAVILLSAAVLTGCGTIRGTAGGFLEGASQDLKSLSTTIKDK